MKVLDMQDAKCKTPMWTDKHSVKLLITTWQYKLGKHHTIENWTCKMQWCTPMWTVAQIVKLLIMTWPYEQKYMENIIIEDITTTANA